MRADGARLTLLLPRGRRLEAAAVSGDRRVVAYVSSDYPRHSEIDVPRASGAGLRRLGAGVQPALSQNGKLLAYVAGTGSVVVGTNGRGRRVIRTPTGEAPSWSPDGKTLLFAEQIHEDPDRYSVVVKPLRGPRHVLFRTGPADAACITVALLPTWSPDGRSIAYEDCEEDPSRAGLYVVRRTGRTDAASRRTPTSSRGRRTGGSLPSSTSAASRSSAPAGEATGGCAWPASARHGRSGRPAGAGWSSLAGRAGTTGRSGPSAATGMACGG